MAEAQENTSSLSKAQKAALLFLLLEEEGAASLFQEMTDDEIKEIGSTLLGMGEIPVDDMTVVLSEFYTEMGIPEADAFSGEKIFTKLVDKTLPENRRGKILNVEDIKGGKGAKQNLLEEMFVEMKPEQVFRMVKSEHPQTLAVFLSLVKPGLAKEVIAQFEEGEQTDLLFRMSLLSQIPEDMIKIMADNYEKKLSSGVADVEEEGEKGSVEIPGLDLVLRYLKTLEWSKAEEMIGQIEKQNADIGAQLKKRIFTLEDMLRADDNGIRNLLKNIETATLSVALKPQEEGVQNKFFENMSTRAATILKEDIEVMPEQKEEDVEAAANLILEEAKKLIGEGQMMLAPLED